MSDLDHRVGVREANLVVRNLRLSNVYEANCEPLIEEIDKLFGIDEVSYNIKEGAIHLAYDATHIDLDGIEAIIRKHGADLHNDWYHPIKLIIDCIVLFFLNHNPGKRFTDLC